MIFHSQAVGERGDSLVFGAQETFLHLPQNKRGSKSRTNEVAHVLQNQCSSALRALTLGHVWTNVPEGTLCNIYVNMASLLAVLQPSLSCEGVRGDLHKGTTKLKGLGEMAS